MIDGGCIGCCPVGVGSSWVINVLMLRYCDEVVSSVLARGG